MYHIEIFDSKGRPGQMERLFRERALPYWRKRGFKVKVYATQNSLGPRQFWLVTEAPNWAHFDQWPQMATGEPEGQAIMAELIELVSDIRASVVKDIEEEGAPQDILLAGQG